MRFALELNYYYYYYYYYSHREIFTPALVYGLSRKSEWLQVSSGLSFFSQYSGWSQRYCSLHGFDSSFDFKFFLFRRLWGPLQVHQLHLVSASPSCSTAFLVLWQGVSIVSLCFLWFSLFVPLWQLSQVDRFVSCLYPKISENFMSYFL